jgi:uncharacterized membrane protein
MNPSKLSVLVWAVCLALCIFSIFWLDATLPDQVVRHFGAGGRADGWTTRPAQTFFFVLISLFLSSLVIGIIALLKFLPPDVLNVPNAKYWRAPEHFQEACAFLSAQAYWIGAISALWCAVFHYLLVKANRLSPPVLDLQMVGLVTSAYVAAVLAWLYLSIRPFFAKPNPPAS